MENLTVPTKELDIEHATRAELFQDPNLVTVSFRRHGAYERDTNSPQRGQLNKETMPATIAAAQEWTSLLPANADIQIITSPTGMPATGPNGAAIMPARARMSGALYGSQLREKFGTKYGYLAAEEVSDRNSEFSQRSKTEYNGQRITDRNIGDIFEFTDNSKGQFVQPFFKKLSEIYGGLTPDFWSDYIKGTLPEDLNETFMAGGGQTALEKAIVATELLIELLEDETPET